MRLQQDSKLWALHKIVITTVTIITSFKKLLYLQFTSSSSFYIALKIVANNIKYVWQLTGFFFPILFHFYCNFFCYLLTYLFTYLFFYFLLCINVVDLLSIKKKKKSSFYVPHLPWVKMNSTNWPVPMSWSLQHSWQSTAGLTAPAPFSWLSLFCPFSIAKYY